MQFPSLRATGLIADLATGLALAAGQAASATFQRSYEDGAASFQSIDAAAAFAGSGEATATFTATAIDYPNAGGAITSATRLGDFLGADGASLSAAADHCLETSVFRFTGWLDLYGLLDIAVGSDDGFALSFDGVEILRHSGPRSFRHTHGTHAFAGPTGFDLLYYENRRNTGVEFTIGGRVVDTCMAAAMPAIPLPASLPALAAGLAGLALIGARRRVRHASAPQA